MLLINLATIYQGGTPTLRHSQLHAEQLSHIQLRYALTWELNPLTTHMGNEFRNHNNTHLWVTYPNPRPYPHTTLPRDNTPTTTKRARQVSKQETPHSLTPNQNPKKKIKSGTTSCKPTPPHASTKPPSNHQPRHVSGHPKGADQHTHTRKQSHSTKPPTMGGPGGEG